jgi:hypothetical protein
MQAMKEHGAQASERNQAIAQRLQERLQEAEARDQQRKEQFQEREARLGEKENRLENMAKSTLDQRKEQQAATEKYRQAALDQKSAEVKMSPGDTITKELAMKDYEAGVKAETEMPGSGQSRMGTAKQILDGLSQKYQPAAPAGPAASDQGSQGLTSPQLPGVTIDSGSLGADIMGLNGGGQRLGDVGQGQTQQAPQMPPEGSIVRRKSDNATGTVVNGQFVWHQPTQGPGKTYMGDYLNSPDSEANGPGAQPALVAPPDQGQ